MGLSSDRAKRRRQLEGLVVGTERRAATLRARLAELDASEAPEPRSSAAPERRSSEARSQDSTAAAATPKATLQRGRMGPPPATTMPAADDVDAGAAPHLPEDGAGDVDEPELETEKQEGPATSTRLLAAALGVRRE